MTKMADHLATSLLLAIPFLVPMLLCSQPVFNFGEPAQWYPGHRYQTQNLIKSENQQIQLIYSDAPFLRQKLSVHKVNLVEISQLVDLTNIAIQTTNLRRTNDLAREHGIQFRHQDF